MPHVKVPVLLWVVHVPAGSPLNVCEYVNALGLGSRDEAVPSVPPTVSMTVTLPSTIVVGSPNVTAAVPLAEASGVKNAALSHVAGAVFVPLAGAEAYVHA